MAKEITLEQIERYNQMVNLASGTPAFYKFGLQMEYMPDDPHRWQTTTGAGRISTYTDGMRFYLKKVCGQMYLYMDLDGEPADRYLLEGHEIAKLFFGA